MTNIFPIDFEEKLTMAQDDYILFSDSEDGNKIKKAQYKNLKGEPWTPWQDWEDGAAATITVGSTTTWAAWSSASVTNVWTSSAAVLDFTIPQWAKWEPWEDGQDWADGAAATITVWTTTTLPAWSSATVTNVWTSQDAILNFGIPKGDQWVWSWDVVWPASSTDWHLAVFDWATGKLIKDGGAIPTGVPSWWTDGQFLGKVSWNLAWATPSWLPAWWTNWQIIMMVNWTPTWVTPTQKGFIMDAGWPTTIKYIWAWDETSYWNLWTYDNNTHYDTY